jgi:hypothetical protein
LSPIIAARAAAGNIPCKSPSRDLNYDIEGVDQKPGAEAEPAKLCHHCNVRQNDQKLYELAGSYLPAKQRKCLQFPSKAAF